MDVRRFFCICGKEQEVAAIYGYVRVSSRDQTVEGKSGSKARDGNPLWRCRCDCGNLVETTKRRLLTGNIRSCGCGKQPPLKDWVGKRFGMLTVLSYARKENGFHLWHCRCD